LICGLTMSALLLASGPVSAGLFTRGKGKVRPLMKGSVGAVQVMGSSASRGQISVRLKVWTPPTRDGRQKVLEKTVTLKPNREVLLGTGERSKVFLRADRKGRVTRRYYQEGFNKKLFMTQSSLFGAEIKKVEVKGKTTQLKGRMYSPISGSDLGLRGRDAKRYTAKGNTLVRTNKRGATHTLGSVWRSLDGRSYKASGLSFSATVTTGKATTLDLGRYRNGFNEPTRVKLHVQDGNIQGMSMVVEGR